MSLEDDRSRAVQDFWRTVEASRREKEAFLREMYTPFVPLEEKCWPSGRTCLAGRESTSTNSGMQRNDSPWALSHCTNRRVPESRLAPHTQAILDGIEPQPFSVGKLSREFLSLLGLPHESIRDMYKQVYIALPDHLTPLLSAFQWYVPLAQKTVADYENPCNRGCHFCVTSHLLP